jgi:hypothetical protein
VGSNPPGVGPSTRSKISNARTAQTVERPIRLVTAASIPRGSKAELGLTDRLQTSLYLNMKAATADTPQSRSGSTELEGKLILDKRVGRSLGALNLVAEHEWNFEEPETKREKTFEMDAAGCWFLTPRPAESAVYCRLSPGSSRPPSEGGACINTLGQRPWCRRRRAWRDL